MNRKLLALAVAALTAPCLAQAAPTIYGNINTSLEYVSDGWAADYDDDVWLVNSNRSRIGIKGGEKLNEEWSAIYKIEWQVASESGSGDLNVRDRFLGFESDKVGTFRAGRFVSPLRAIEKNVDQFNFNLLLDMENWVPGQNRINNSLGYTTPTLGGAFKIDGALQQGEDTNGQNGLADGYSIALSYDQNGLYLALGFDEDIGTNVNPGTETLRFVAGYVAGDLELGALVQTHEYPNDADLDSILLSAGYKLDAKNKVKGQFVTNDGDGGESWMLALGLDHSLSQATTVYTHIAYQDWEWGADSDNGFVVGVGASHNF